MKNLTTSSRLVKARLAIAGFALMVLSGNLTQAQNCDAHFLHFPSHNGSTGFYPAPNSFGTAYAWDFGDGNTSTDAHPHHAYLQSGTYNTCLTVTDTDATGAVVCTATWCDSVHFTVPPPPVCNAHFTHRRVRFSAGTVYFGAGFNPRGSTYAWDFGDNGTSTSIFPHHTYAASGTYYACLTVTDTDATGAVLCTATWCDSVRVMLPVIPTPVTCNAHFRHRTDNSTGTVDFRPAPNPVGTSYSWDLGNGTTSTVRNPNATYAQSGIYNVCLTVTDTDATGAVVCTSTWCDSIRVTLPPPPTCDANFYSHRTFGSLTSVYFNAAHNPSGASYAWDFGDGSTATSAGPLTFHTYAQAGDYNACLTVTDTDAAGVVLCTATWCDSVHVIVPTPTCDAHFDADNEWHPGLTVHFEPAHNISNTIYTWDFGDGTTVSTRDTSHTFAIPGAYNVCLTVTSSDQLGIVICTSTWCDSVRVDTNHVCSQPHHLRMMSNSSTANLTGTASVKIYPNPMSEKSVLHIENTFGNVTFSIFENTGRLVSTKQNLTNGDVELNKSELRSGLYFYQLRDEDGNVINGKLIVQ